MSRFIGSGLSLLLTKSPKCFSEQRVYRRGAQARCARHCDESYRASIARAKGLDFRKRPNLYRVRRCQQGVFTVEPYKSEILLFWKFKTQDNSVVSADSIHALFEFYLDQGDFVGADVAKKNLHMRFTHYAPSEKAFSTEVFKHYWTRTRLNEK